MRRYQNPSDNAIQYIKDTLDFRQNLDFDLITEYVKEELSEEMECLPSEYLDGLINEIPPNNLPELLDRVSDITTPKSVGIKIALFLVTSERPIFQLKGIQLISKLNIADFVPYIIDYIYSEHPELQKAAMDTVSKLHGNAEFILKTHLKSRSKQKRHIAKRLLRRINPQNVNLALYSLDDEDFIVRVEAVEVIGNTKNSKYLRYLKPLLNDNDMAVRKAAAEGIAKIGGIKAKALLQDVFAIETHEPLKGLIYNLMHKI